MLAVKDAVIGSIEESLLAYALDAASSGPERLKTCG